MSKFLKYGDEGPRVKELQRLLNKNSLHKMRRKIVVDGQFGTLTSAAIQSTKYWLGYPKSELKSIAGEQLFTILKTGQLTHDYAERRKLRQAKREREREAQTDVAKMRLRVLKRIKGELGTLEQPNNSNHIKYNDYWGWGPVAYCVIGISWAWLMEHSTAFVKGNRWAGAREMLGDARFGGRGLHLTHDPDPGCPGVIDFTGDASPDHAITFVRDNGNGTCQTYEFNTTKTGTYIQGVFNKTRPLRDCWWFVVER